MILRTLIKLKYIYIVTCFGTIVNDDGKRRRENIDFALSKLVYQCHITNIPTLTNAKVNRLRDSEVK